MKKLILCIIIFLTTFTLVTSQVRIKMEEENGVYTTPCVVNGLKLRFIFDTGASTVSLSLSEAIFMFKNGYLDKNDIHGSSYSQIANGEIVENTTVVLKELQIGSITIYNVEATILHELSAPILLGQSAIKKLGKIQIDGDELIIMAGNPQSDNDELFANNNSQFVNEDDCNKANELLKKAREYYKEKLFSLSSETYKSVSDLCPFLLNCTDYFIISDILHKSKNYQEAIVGYKEYIACGDSTVDLYLANLNMGRIYDEINDYSNSILHYQKAISNTDDGEKMAVCYCMIGQGYNMLKYDNSAIENFERSIKIYLDYIGLTTEDIKEGKVNDEHLGGLIGLMYFQLYRVYSKVGNEYKSMDSLVKSIQCGNKDAMIFCDKNNINYKALIKYLDNETN